MVPRTSVETTLNSRFSSGKGHWGEFDNEAELNPQHLDLIKLALDIPRFTSHQLHVKFFDDRLLLGVELGLTGHREKFAHIESGMQQQAVYLACAAIGIGTCILNVGVYGDIIEGMHATARMIIKPIKPSYFGSFWTTSPPKSWMRANLPSPDLRGKRRFFDVIEEMEISKNGRRAGTRDVSQLLWAARGRTPHKYRGKEWGMTIPTWAGGQNFTSVHLLNESGLFEYVNWSANAPTHAIREVNRADVSSIFPECLNCLIFSTNEDTLRALWEIGYMLENTIAQAVSLGVAYEASLLSGSVVDSIRLIGIDSPVAVLSLKN